VTINYTKCFPYSYETGEALSLRGKVWDCVIPCTFVGVTADDEVVLKGAEGPKLNEHEFLPRGVLKTRGKPGQVPIEVTTLGMYEFAGLERFTGKKITASGHPEDNCVLIICEDLTYFKARSSIRYGEEVLETESLTMKDLKRFNLISEAVWTTFESQRDKVREADAQRQYERSLLNAAGRLGKAKALEILSSSRE
jgi:hypothetical protein